MKATDTAPGKRKQKAKMNLPNRLTVLRLIMVPVFIAVMVLPDSVVPALVTGIIGAFLFITAAGGVLGKVIASTSMKCW